MKLGSVKNNRPISEGINMGPLIDIVFILLIFFVVTARFDNPFSKNLQRPKASGSPVASETKKIIIQIDGLGRITLKNKFFTLARLEEHLKLKKTSEYGIAANENYQVYIDAHQNTSAALLVKVMDSIEAGGFKDNIHLGVDS